MTPAASSVTRNSGGLPTKTRSCRSRRIMKASACIGRGNNAAPKKATRQENVSVNTPPISGPRNTAPPQVAAKVPKTRGTRRLSNNSRVMT